MAFLKSILTCFAVSIAFGCTTKGSRQQVPYSLADNIDKNAVLVDKLNEPTQNQPDKNETLSLKMAMTKALKKNKSLEAALWQVNSKEGLILQSKLWQNPEINLEVGHLFGRNGNKEVESQLQISQVIELGGKIKQRTKVAQAEKEIAIQEALALRVDVLTEVSLLFMDVVEAQLKLEQHEKNFDIAKKIHSVVSDKAKAGKVSILEENKALLVLNQTQQTLSQAKSTFSTSKVKLSKMWGGTTEGLEKVDFQLGFVEVPLQSFNEQEVLNGHAVQLSQLNVKLAEQKAMLEKAIARPDISVSLGFQKYEENSENAFVVGLTFPLIIFNKNQGNIKSANTLEMKALVELKHTINNLISELEEINIDMESLRKKIIFLKEEVCPSAKNILDGAQTGYQKGNFDYLTVLDAQKSLFEININLIETEIEYKRKIIKKNSLVGKVEIIK